jgi:hypothetical protein
MQGSCKQWVLATQAKRNNSLPKDVMDLVVDFWTCEIGASLNKKDVMKCRIVKRYGNKMLLNFLRIHMFLFLHITMI